MRRFYFAYLISAAGLIIISILWISISQTTGIKHALGNLGKGERQYEQAREQILLSDSDPASLLYTYIKNKKKSDRARIQALTILRDVSYHQALTSAGAHLIPLLSNDNAAMNMEILKTLEIVKSLDSCKAVVRIFQTAVDTGLFQQSFRTLKESVTSLEKKLNQSVQTHDSACVESCAALVRTIPVSKGKYYPILAEYYRSSANFALATDYSRKSAFISKWWVLGGFPNQRMSGYYTNLGPEQRAFYADDVFETAEGKSAKWFSYQRNEPSGIINICNLFVKQQNSVAYFFTYVISPEDRDGLVFCGSDDQVKVWFNDSLVWGNPTYRGCFVDDDVTRIRIRKGVNKLLVKVVQDLGGGSLSCRLTDLNGEAMGDVAISLTETPGADPVSGVVVEALAGKPVWMAHADSLYVQDGEVSRALLRIVTDESADQKMRQASLQVLDRINARWIPFGELDLIECASRIAKSGAPNPLLKSLVQSLLSINSANALDLGLLMRKDKNPELRQLGEQLIGAFCMNRLINFGTPLLQKGDFKAERIVHQIEGVTPNHVWTIERLAAFYEKNGYAQKADELYGRIRMPSRWLMRTCSVQLPSKVDSKILPTSIAVDSLAIPLKGVDGRGKPSNDVFTILTDKNDCLILSSVVECPRDDSLLITIMLPAKFDLIVNGDYAGSQSNESAMSYDLGNKYREQPLLLDGGVIKTAFKKGKNTIHIIKKSGTLPGMRQCYFRIGFASNDGIPIGCKNNTLIFKDN